MRESRSGSYTATVVLGVFGASLLYGDDMITPAISVLSAIEGLEVVTPFFKPYVLPITIVLGDGLFDVVCRYGYMEHVDIPALLERITNERLKRIDPMDTTYILGLHRLIVTKRPSGMATWRERVFASMMRNATSASNFFGLPPNRVVELGAQTEL